MSRFFKISPPLILVTRPLHQVAPTAHLLKQAGLAMLHVPLRQMTPLPFVTPPPEAEIVLATSANAFYGWPEEGARFRHLPLFVVGQASAQAAKQAGFTNIFVAEGSAEALFTLLTSHVSCAHKLLYLAGEIRQPTLEEQLQAYGFSVHVAVRYALQDVDRAPEELVNAFRNPKNLAAALHFSAHNVTLLLRLMAQEELVFPPDFTHACLSPAIAQHVHVHLGAKARVATALRSDQQDLITRLAAELTNPPDVSGDS